MANEVTLLGRGSRPLAAVAIVVLSCTNLWAQAGRRQTVSSTGATVINVVASRDDGTKDVVQQKNIALYENGLEQTIKSWVPDPSPARIVLLVDNSLSIRADVDKLEQAAKEFAYEIFEGDKLLIVGYDENAEIVTDWTDDPKLIETTLKNFRKKGDPHLFDALTAVAEDGLRPLSASVQKQVVVVISDGLDRGSNTKFETLLANLQRQNIAVYCVQLPDRTGGALRRDVPKPKAVIEQLAEGTGGRVFPITEASQAAKSICDELRKNRYLLSYWPSNASMLDARRLLVIGDEGITVRYKNSQPAVTQ
jgi:VWFA-related protein